MVDNRFDGEQFELYEMHAYYDTFNDLPEHRRKEFLKYVHDLDHVKYENFIDRRYSRAKWSKKGEGNNPRI